MASSSSTVEIVRTLIQSQASGWEKTVIKSVTELENELFVTKFERDSHKEDFERERKDREDFHGKADEEQQQLRRQIEESIREVSRLENENKILTQTNMCVSCKKMKSEAEAYKTALEKCKEQLADKEEEIKGLMEKIDRIKLIQSEGRAHSPPYTYKAGLSQHATIYQEAHSPVNYQHLPSQASNRLSTAKTHNKPAHMIHTPHSPQQQAGSIHINDLPEPAVEYDERISAVHTCSKDTETTQFHIDEEQPKYQYEHHYQNIPGELDSPVIPRNSTIATTHHGHGIYGSGAGNDVQVSLSPGYFGTAVSRLTPIPASKTELPKNMPTISYAAEVTVISSGADSTNSCDRGEVSEDYFVSGKPNKMQENLTEEIKVLAHEVLGKTNLESLDHSLDPEVPLDPNLVCPWCRMPFRVGQIQKFRRHVGVCSVETNQLAPPVPTPRKNTPRSQPG